MLPYLIRRISILILTLWGITIITFAILHLAPGGPLSPLTEFNPKITPEYREKLVKMYGLDKPLHIQYLNWLKGILKLDFGRSFSLDQRPVWDKIKERLPITLLINTLSLLLIILFSFPLGVISAVRAGSLSDKLITFFSFFWICHAQFLVSPSFDVNLWCETSAFTNFRPSFGSRI